MKIAVFGDREEVLAFKNSHKQYEITFGDWDNCVVGVVLPNAPSDRNFFMQQCAKRNTPVIHPLILDDIDAEIQHAVREYAEQKFNDVPARIVKVVQGERVDFPEPSARAHHLLDILIVASVTHDGMGGAEKSLRELCYLLRKAEYSTLLVSHDTFLHNMKRGSLYPKVCIVQSAIALKVGPVIRQLWPDTYKMQYTQCVAHLKDTEDWDAYIANSPFTAKAIGSKGVKCDVMVKPPMDPDAFMVSPEQDRGEAAKSIVCVSMLPGKGGDIFKKIAERMPDDTFIGVRGEGNLPNLTVHDWVYDMRGIYAQAAVVVCPSLVEEGFGRVPVEALSNGIPVVVSDRGNLPSFASACPGMVKVVSAEADIVEWVEAVEQAKQIDTSAFEPPESLWNRNIDGLLAHLKHAGIRYTAKRPSLWFTEAGGSGLGIGDALMLLPTLQELAGSFKIYVYGGFAGAPDGLEILRLDRKIHLEKPPAEAIWCPMKVLDKKEPLTVGTREPRHQLFAKQGCVKPTTWIPNIRLRKGILQDVAGELPDTRRKLVGVALLANHRERSMGTEAAKALVQELAKHVHVCVFHKVQSVAQHKHITDYGGVFSVKEFIHVASHLDGIVSVCGGLAHLGCAFGIPTVVLFGPTGPGGHIRYLNYLEKDADNIKELSLGLDCQPCYYERGEGCRPYPPCFDFDPKVVWKTLKKML